MPPHVCTRRKIETGQLTCLADAFNACVHPSIRGSLCYLPRKTVRGTQSSRNRRTGRLKQFLQCQRGWVGGGIQFNERKEWVTHPLPVGGMPHPSPPADAKFSLVFRSVQCHQVGIVLHKEIRTRQTRLFSHLDNTKTSMRIRVSPPHPFHLSDI